MKKMVCLAVLIVVSVWSENGLADESAFRDLYSDTWVATDALGRSLPLAGECPAPRPDRVVGIFYFLWMGGHGTDGPFDLTQLIAANPAAPQYAAPGKFHHWGEPEIGYYLSDSDYAIRRHVSMLNDAGVDVIIFDITNAVTYPDVYMKLFAIYRDLRARGHHTPQVCFLTHSNPVKTIEKVYEHVYKAGQYRELWFMWKGKPLILGPGAGLSEEVKAFFTIRDCWAWTHGKDTWQWLDHSPQQYGWHESPDQAEECSVSAAEHSTSNIGRSFHEGKQPPVDEHFLSPLTPKGLFFAEQWKRALEIDPEFVFITGWNEWVAQRFLNSGQIPFLGKPVKEGDTFFVDQYNQEYSRDIEPMKGGHSDNYYYQMIDGIRRYKGVRPLPPGQSRPVKIDGSFDDWKSVQPEYRDTIGDTPARDEQGWGKAGRYVNQTGRNDFVSSKTTHDDSFVYFYAETAKPVSPHTDPDWMLLLIDTDQNPQTGWNGYDLLVNSQVFSPISSAVKNYEAGIWKQTGRALVRCQGNRLELRLDRALLGERAQSGEKISFDFHWADNCQGLGDIVNFSLYGDSAPNRRFNYRYISQ